MSKKSRPARNAKVVDVFDEHQGRLNMLQILAGAVPEDAHIFSHATHVDGSSSGTLSGVPLGSWMPRSNVRATNSHKLSEWEALDEACLRATYCTACLPGQAKSEACTVDARSVTLRCPSSRRPWSHFTPKIFRTGCCPSFDTERPCRTALIRMPERRRYHVTL